MVSLNISRLSTAAGSLLTLFGIGEWGYLYPLVLFALDFLSWILIKTIQTLLKVKADINWGFWHPVQLLYPCRMAHDGTSDKHFSFFQRSRQIGLSLLFLFWSVLWQSLNSNLTFICISYYTVVRQLSVIWLSFSYSLAQSINLHPVFLFWKHGSKKKVQNMGCKKQDAKKEKR